MLRVVIRRVNPEHLDESRAWLATANGPRAAEALATLAGEGCRHERAHLIENAQGPVLLNVMEVEDLGRSRPTVKTSTHPIDADHRRVTDFAVGRDRHVGTPRLSIRSGVESRSGQDLMQRQVIVNTTNLRSRATRRVAALVARRVAGVQVPVCVRESAPAERRQPPGTAKEETRGVPYDVGLI